MTYDELKRKYHDEGLDEYLDVRFDVKWGPEYVVTICKEPDDTFTVIRFGERGDRDMDTGMTEDSACKQVYSMAVGQKKFIQAYREKTQRKEQQ